MTNTEINDRFDSLHNNFLLLVTENLYNSCFVLTPGTLRPPVSCHKAGRGNINEFTIHLAKIRILKNEKIYIWRSAAVRILFAHKKELSIMKRTSLNIKRVDPFRQD